MSVWAIVCCRGAKVRHRELDMKLTPRYSWERRGEQCVGFFTVVRV